MEAEQLVAAAIEAHRRDPLGTAAERIDLLLTRARDCRPNAEWDQVLPCAAEAIALARREEDLARLAAAAAAATDNLVWLPQQWNEVPEDTIEDLRWALAELPAGDSPDRCRVMLALAVLLYYDPGTGPRSWRSPRRAQRWPGGSATRRCRRGPADGVEGALDPARTPRPDSPLPGKGSRRPGPPATSTPRRSRSSC